MDFYRKPPSFEDFSDLWLQTDWPPYSCRQFSVATDTSSAWMTAYIDQTLIGNARLVSDEARYGYIQDVLVHKDYRRKGIAHRLVRSLIQVANEFGPLEVHLLSTKEAVKLYHKLGFEANNQVEHLRLR